MNKLLFRLSFVALALATGTVASAQQISGTVTKIDEPAGTVTIEPETAATTGASGATRRPRDYRLQDGLMFNALRFGDKVRFRAETVNGVETITELTRQ